MEHGEKVILADGSEAYYNDTIKIVDHSEMFGKLAFDVYCKNLVGHEFNWENCDKQTWIKIASEIVKLSRKIDKGEFREA